MGEMTEIASLNLTRQSNISKPHLLHAWLCICRLECWLGTINVLELPLRSKNKVANERTSYFSRIQDSQSLLHPLTFPSLFITNWRRPFSHCFYSLWATDPPQKTCRTPLSMIQSSHCDQTHWQGVVLWVWVNRPLLYSDWIPAAPGPWPHHSIAQHQATLCHMSHFL